MQIRDYIRKENTKEKTHRNLKSEIPQFFENQELQLNKEPGLSEVDAYKQGKTPRVQSTLGLESDHPTHS